MVWARQAFSRSPWRTVLDRSEKAERTRRWTKPAWGMQGTFSRPEPAEVTPGAHHDATGKRAASTGRPQLSGRRWISVRVAGGREAGGRYAKPAWRKPSE